MAIIRYGTDSSGRPIYMSEYMARVWRQILADPAVAAFADDIVIVQGAWMSKAGGGAAASAGYHDRGGCLDTRTWNLTGTQVDTFIRTARRYGFAFWRRDARHGGMDPHAHGVLGTDSDLSTGAGIQWRQYLDGRDGLASNGPDYEWRPSPLVTTPPPEDDMPYTKQELSEIVREAVRAELDDQLDETKIDNPTGKGKRKRATLGALLFEIRQLVEKR